MSKKICKDCKWVKHYPGKFDWPWSYCPEQFICNHPDTINLVTGEMSRSSESMRSPSSLCKPEALLFEPMRVES